MLTLQAEAQLEVDLEQGTCALEAETAIKLLTLKQVEENAKEGQNSTSVSDTMTNLVPSYNGGEWSLFFANCQKPSVVSFDLTASMYNVHGGQRDYLAIGEDMIPSVYLVSLQQPHKQTSTKVAVIARICPRILITTPSACWPEPTLWLSTLAKCSMCVRGQKLSCQLAFGIVIRIVDSKHAHACLHCTFHKCI